MTNFVLSMTNETNDFISSENIYLKKSILIIDKSVWNKIKKMKDKVPVNYAELEKLFSCKENTNKRASAVTKVIPTSRS